MREATGGMLGMVLDALGTRVAYLDAGFCFRYVNAAFAASVGRSTAELIGCEYGSLPIPDDARVLPERALDAGEPITLKAVPWPSPSRPGAETCYCDWLATPVIEGLAVTGIVLSITDVTEREEQRQARASFLTKMAFLSESARQMRAERTVDSLLRRVADAATKLTGGRLAVVRRTARGEALRESVASREEGDSEGSTLDDLLWIEHVLDTLPMEGRPSIRLTQDELGEHPALRTGAEEHKPLGEVLVARLTGQGDQPGGLIAILDRAGNGLTTEDEALVIELASIASEGLERVAARAQIERCADQLDAILDAIVDPVFVYNAAGAPARANAAAVAAAGGVDPVGADRAQLLRTFSVTHPDGRTVAIPDLPSNRALRGETVRNEPLIFHTPQGEQRAIVATASPLYSHGMQDGAVLVWHDLTELQQAQEARDRLLDILERTPDIVATATPDGELLYANRAARETIGSPEDASVEGQPMFRAHPDWAAQVVLKEAVPTALREGMWRGQTAIITYDGREVPASQVVLAHYAPEGDVEYLSTIIRDVSQEQRLLEENRRQRRLLERLMAALPVGVAVVSGPEHRYEYANRHYQDVIHHAGESVVGQTIRDLLPIPAAEQATAMLREAYRTKTTTSRQAVALPGASADAPRYFDIDHVPLLAEDGAVESVLILAHEVTDQVRTHSELESERARLQAIIDNVPDGIVVMDAAAQLKLVNRVGKQVYGHPLVLGERYDRQPEIPLYRPDGRQYDPRDLHVVRSALDGETYRDEEVVVIDGESRHRHLLVNSAPIRDATGALDGAVVAYRDITGRVELQEALQRYADELDRKVAEQTAALRASQERLRAIFEGAAVGVGLSDAEGHMVECNPVLAAITGYSVDELLEMRFADFTHEDDVGADLALFGELLAGQRDAYQLEKRYVRKDGQIVWVNLTVSLIRDGENQPPLAIGIVEDITERKEAYEALIQAEKLSAAGRLAASLAHEINNPLQAVIGCLGLAERKLAKGEDVAQYVQVARQELRRASRVVAQMRDLHRRSRVGTREPTEINVLLDQVLLVSAKQCETQGVEFSLVKSGEEPIVSAVPDQLRQVFLNLVLNALDAMPDGGLLTVTVSSTQDPRGASVQFRDNGTGIAPDVLPRLFEPFYSTRAGGLGLGLFISRNIIEDHGGHIEISSTVGRGSTFTVWLPEA